MIFWTREIAGWLLVALGLAAFWKVYEMSLQYHIFELIPMTVIGIFLFRGGIHLLKVAVAARACREAQAAAVSRRRAGVGPAADGANGVAGELASVSWRRAKWLQHHPPRERRRG